MRRLTRAVALLALILLIGGPTSALAQEGMLDRQGGGDNEPVERLDLSAMMLTPWDLAEEGLDGYGLSWGGTDTADEEFANLIAGESSPDDVLETLEDAGLVQSRWVLMDLPSEDDPAYAARRVAVFVDEYTGTEGLSDVMEIYLDFGNDIEETEDTIGDESFITTYTDVDPDTGVDVTAMVLAFRYENQIAQVNVSDYVTQLPDAEPAVDEIVALAERLLDRIETVREDGSTGIEHLMLRLESDGELIYYNADFYTRLDDELLPRFGQDDDLLEEIEDAEQSLGMTDAYRLVQTVGNTGERYIQYGSQIRLFDNEDGAAEWVDSAEDWMAMFGSAELEVIDTDLDLGDAAAVVSYQSENDLGTFYTIAIFVQVDDTGTLVQVTYPEELPELDVVAELAEMQVACIEDGECPTESPVPDSLIDLADTL
jgi:hypothetical protein